MHPADLFVGEKIVSIRRKRNITQDELSERLGLAISRQQIQKYETGETRIPISILYDIACAMQIKIEHLLEGIENVTELPISISSIVEHYKKRPINLLIIEDNLADEKLTRKALDESGHQINIYTASDGIEALCILHNSKQLNTYPKPDLIFLDLSIPKKDGFEVLKTIKTDSNLHDIPVVVVTTSINAEEMRRAYKLGSGGFIVKSFHPKEYAERIKIVMDYWSNMALPTM